MDFIRITADYFPELKKLHSAYKKEIGEEAPTDAQLECLYRAVENGDIEFFGCVSDNILIACCSVSHTFSTFNYDRSGVFEDFYIMPDYRHKGIVRKLIRYSIEQSNVRSLTVGCADCDVGMYDKV